MNGSPKVSRLTLMTLIQARALPWQPVYDIYHNCFDKKTNNNRTKLLIGVQISRELALHMSQSLLSKEHSD